MLHFTIPKLPKTDLNIEDNSAVIELYLVDNKQLKPLTFTGLFYHNKSYVMVFTYNECNKQTIKCVCYLNVFIFICKFEGSLLLGRFRC
jgi:hypothetical protein